MNISRTKRALDEIKTYFIVFEGLSLVKNKKLLKIVDTSAISTEYVFIGDTQKEKLKWGMVGCKKWKKINS